MADKILKTRVIINNKTNAEWEDIKDSFIPLKGEIIIYSDQNKAKIGNGVTAIGDLPFAWLSDTEIAALINNARLENEDVLLQITQELVNKLGDIKDWTTETDIEKGTGEDAALSDSDSKVPTSKLVKKEIESAINDHTHTMDDVTDLPDWVKAEDKPEYTAEEVGAIDATKKGAAGGVAELDATGKVPTSQLPSYVDDVVEGYIDDNKFYEDAAKSKEVELETGKIYVDIPSNVTYRYGGEESGLVEISTSLALGETSSTAFAGDKGKVAYDFAVEHSKQDHAPADAEKNIINAIEVNGEEVTPDATGKVSITTPDDDTTYTLEKTSAGKFKFTSSNDEEEATELDVNVNDLVQTAGDTLIIDGTI